jgi:hypothetical protein
MARVQGIKEKVHAPLYDAFSVKEGNFEDATKGSRLLRFFMDVQGKSKLETNLQAAGVLPSLNTFEARALRVIPSSLKSNGGTVTAAAPAEFANDFVFNSVTTLLVGEKVMIEMPTYWFPSGAGVFANGSAPVANHGNPDPTATFRFAEPVFIEPQQNFRVEILFPDDVPDTVKSAGAPLRVWVVLDGYLTRDAQ